MFFPACFGFYSINLYKLQIIPSYECMGGIFMSEEENNRRNLEKEVNRTGRSGIWARLP